MPGKDSGLHDWEKFSAKFKLSAEQTEQFKTYYDFLIEYNKTVNLTTITSLRRVIDDHFADSMVLPNFIELEKVKSLADVGAGAGFPAIPLKILFPHLRLLLIEVTYKKRKFLEQLVGKLGLRDVEICDLDWRTFLRITQGEIDLFVSRAALDEVELCRLFRSNCSYRNAQMAYWVSESWEPHKKVTQYIRRVEDYAVGGKNRKLVFMGLSTVE